MAQAKPLPKAKALGVPVMEHMGRPLGATTRPPRARLAQAISRLGPMARAKVLGVDMVARAMVHGVTACHPEPHNRDWEPTEKVSLPSMPRKLRRRVCPANCHRALPRPLHQAKLQPHLLR